MEPLSDSWLQAKGNEAADIWAKKGAALHDLPDASEREGHLKRAVLLKKFLKMIGSILPLWPALGPSEHSRKEKRKGKSQRPPGKRGQLVGAEAALAEVRPPERGEQVAPPPDPIQPLGAKQPHQWVWKRGHWACSACLMRAMTDEARLRRLSEECKGSLEPLVELVKRPKGHALQAFDYLDGSGSFLVACSKCGSFAEGCYRSLAKKCTRGFANKFAKYAWGRIGRGMHPKPRRGLVGVVLSQGIPLLAALVEGDGELPEAL